jgi:hypothetical protein
MHEDNERQVVAMEVANRLRDRGIQIVEKEDPEDLAVALEAVERFEEAVKRHGGDLMVDDLDSSEPDDPRFVIPPREAGESLSAYALRIDAARNELEKT